MIKKEIKRNQIKSALSLKHTIIKTAKTAIRKYLMTNNVLDYPQIRQKRKQRNHYKCQYKIAIEKKNVKNRKIALNNYRNSQMGLKRTIEHHITENIEKRLKKKHNKVAIQNRSGTL